MTVRSLVNALALAAAGVVLAGCLPAATVSQPSAGPSVPAEVNSAPVISGSPATQVMSGISYEFQPIASDSDGDALSFSATGLPAWATINPQTGRVQGTPDESNAGTSSGIVVRVTDGSASASLPAFSITVMALPVTPPPAPPPAPPPTPVPATGVALLSWTIPVQHTDGSPLASAQLLGYRVYHGTSPTSLSPYHDVDGAGNTTYEARELATGQHCFAVSAVTVTNVESALSGIGCKQI